MKAKDPLKLLKYHLKKYELISIILIIVGGCCMFHLNKITIFNLEQFGIFFAILCVIAIVAYLLVHMSKLVFNINKYPITQWKESNQLYKKHRYLFRLKKFLVIQFPFIWSLVNVTDAVFGLFLNLMKYHMATFLSTHSSLKLAIQNAINGFQTGDIVYIVIIIGMYFIYKVKGRNSISVCMKITWSVITFLIWLISMYFFSPSN